MNKKKHFQKFAYKDSRRWLKHHDPHRGALHGHPQEELTAKVMLWKYPDLEAEYRDCCRQQAYRMRQRHKRLDDAMEPPRSWRWRELLAVREAKNITVRLHKGHTALKLITLVYWPSEGQESLPIEEAGRTLGLTLNQTRKLHNGFLHLVEERYRMRKDWVW